MIGQCDHTEDHTDIADKIDDYLWLKLSQVQFQSDGSSQEEFTLSKLQKLLYEDYGRLITVNILKIGTSKIIIIRALIGTVSFYSALIDNDVDEMTNSLNSDQTAPKEQLACT